ncbi:MAG: FAD-binding oxidoreductase, partial [Desulfobulbaceae bacterium]|nr:FAD-binding oxidoreductase [Desulfobulbaceae bacterium]
KQLVPAYAGDCRGGIVSRLDGYALPALTLRAFFNSACSAGAKPFTRCKVTAISHTKDGFAVVAEDGRLFRSEVVINSSGAWGNNIAALMNDHLPIEPVGLSMMVTARRPQFIKPVIGVHGRKLSFKQMTNGTVVIGGAHTAFLDMKKERTTINISEVKKSAETVMKYFPIMAEATIVRSWAGIEGVMSDGLPVIDESQTTPGLFHVCGFSTHGFQMAPMIGRLVTSLVLGKKPEFSLDAFSINRFKTTTSLTKKVLLNKGDKYEHK